MRPLFGDQPSRLDCALPLYNEAEGLDNKLNVKYYQCMTKKPKPMTVAEAGRKGGKARAKKYPPEQLSEWASKGGWPKGRPRKPKQGKKGRNK